MKGILWKGKGTMMQGGGSILREKIMGGIGGVVMLRGEASSILVRGGEGLVVGVMG